MPASVAGTTSKDCGNQDLAAQLSTKNSVAAMKGNYTPYSQASDCPNQTGKSDFKTSQALVAATADNQQYVTCMNWRTSQDSTTYVSGYSVGNQIKFKAGFKIFSNA